MWVGLPGISNITSTATWWDTTQVYPGSGVPGAGGTGGNTSDACAKNSSVKLTPNTTGTNSVGITFGTENSANSTGNNGQDSIESKPINFRNYFDITLMSME